MWIITEPVVGDTGMSDGGSGDSVNAKKWQNKWQRREERDTEAREETLTTIRLKNRASLWTTLTGNMLFLGNI